ncbi:putative uncharacterized protein [Prevotella sp. CAG:1185]|nr:putative uncharacterized protein [Prevotella sp. CAG:1185]
MRMKLLAVMAAAALMASNTQQAEACTGITLKSADGTSIPARTIEWGGSDLNSKYVIVPRGYTQKSYVPGGQKNGLEFTAKYGYVGFAVEQEEFVAEGLNEKGLSAGLFYFPGYGKYENYNEANRQSSIADLQLVSWILGNFSTVDEVIKGMKDVHVVAIDPRASTVHWRITEPSGRQIVIEITEGKVNLFENKLGVLTNSPGFEWQMTNLNNYVNLYPGTAKAKTLDGTNIASFGAGSGFLGIPGDVTPPSRFVRAAFYQATAPKKQTAEETVLQCFQILNNFDIPVGIEFADGETPADIPSATQWTSATDMKNLAIYYRTMHNSAIRKFDLKTIKFDKVKYQAVLLDATKDQPITTVKVK